MTGTQSYKWSQAGDFNTNPTTLPMTIIRDHASLSDAWEVTRPPYSPTPASSTSMPSPSQAIETFGVTTDSPLNFYSAGKHLVAYAIAWQGKHLNYILFRDPAPLSPAAQFPSLIATSARVLLTEPVPGSPFSYSDHFGVSATLQIKYPDHARSTTSNNELRMAQNQPMATINPTTHPDIMVKSPETGSDAQPFWYARVIGIFHALGDSKSEFEIGHDLDEAEEPYNVDDEDGASDWESDAIDTISSSDSDSDGSNCASDGYANF